MAHADSLWRRYGSTLWSTAVPQRALWPSLTGRTLPSHSPSRRLARPQAIRSCLLSSHRLSSPVVVAGLSARLADRRLACWLVGRSDPARADEHRLPCRNQAAGPPRIPRLLLAVRGDVFRRQGV